MPGEEFTICPRPKDFPASPSILGNSIFFFSPDLAFPTLFVLRPGNLSLGQKFGRALSADGANLYRVLFRQSDTGTFQTFLSVCVPSAFRLGPSHSTVTLATSRPRAGSLGAVYKRVSPIPVHPSLFDLAVFFSELTIPKSF